MQDFRPVFYVIGQMLVVLAALLLIPAALDAAEGNGNAGAFLTSALISGATGVLLALSTRNALRKAFDTRQAYMLTVAAWISLPAFGCLPFILGAPGLSLTDAYFESVSGITTTGSTMILGLDELPAGMNLWRGMLNSIGGLGIAFVAMIFLPVMRVGGMQFFKVQGYDTFGKLLPRASDIALSLLGVYASLTMLCILTYAALDMEPLDAVVMGLASIATGGFAPTDISFTKYPGAPEYAASLFMFLGALPYVRYVQMVTGQSTALWRDAQVRALLRWVLYFSLAVTLWRVWMTGSGFEETFRTTLINLVSVFTGTGFFSGDFPFWGGFVLIAIFVAGLIGGCSGSSSGALSVFRVQLILAAIWAQMRQINAPSRIVPLKYQGRTVDDDTRDALVTFSTAYILILGLLSCALTTVGVDSITAVFGVWSSMGNIGYAIGPMVAETGTYKDVPEAAKWILILAMLLGRMALLSAFVVLMPRFWRA